MSVVLNWLGLIISYFTNKGGSNADFFKAGKQSPWYLVAFGMIGASLSGVTFISVPGWVEASQFSYFQVVLGYTVGYAVIGTVLLPLYYRLNLTSIYTYLDGRFGKNSYKTGASFFLLSRVVGASFRLYLVAIVLQSLVFDAMGVPFWVTVSLTILLIWLYTFKSGIKTIVWTDTLQTSFLLLAVVISIWMITDHMELSMADVFATIGKSEKSTIFDWDWRSNNAFYKSFLAGIFITIAMNGLDQNVMQKNLTCKSKGEAQKNIFWFSIVFFFSTVLFLALGVLLYKYAMDQGIAIPERTDDLYPLLALNHFGILAGVVFLLGITAAAFSSADSALTALTTSFCVDILDIQKKEKNQKKTRLLVHIGFTILMFLVIIVFNSLNDSSVVSAVFKVAGFTYCPLLGLFAYGLLCKNPVRDKWVPVVCILSPVISVILDFNSEAWLNGYQFGFEILLVNAAITMLGLFALYRPKTDEVSID